MAIAVSKYRLGDFNRLQDYIAQTTRIAVLPKLATDLCHPARSLAYNKSREI